MLVKVNTLQVTEYWDIFAPAILKAIPPGYVTTFNILSNILRALLAEEAELWVWYRNEEDLESLNPIYGVLTGVQNDRILGTSSLLIYALFAFGNGEDKALWDSGTETLSKYARGLGCANIKAYTQIPTLAKFLKSKGWDIETALITLEV